MERKVSDIGRGEVAGAGLQSLKFARWGSLPTRVKQSSDHPAALF